MIGTYLHVRVSGSVCDLSVHLSDVKPSFLFFSFLFFSLPTPLAPCSMDIRRADATRLTAH